uniref:Uncharacterized protein n=1 Tax=Aegilops tauschii subsp. strangulata TaxID=200361 RepID=A0A453CR92_AEGTS
MAELKHKPFEQVRRAIMKILKLNEATHELNLHHILCVRTVPSAAPYHVLTDIIGEASWMAFLKVSLLQVRAFRLLACWTVKKRDSVPNASDSNNTTVPDEGYESDDGTWPNCKHDRPCTIETSWRTEDPGRRFFPCPLFMSAFGRRLQVQQMVGQEVP